MYIPRHGNDREKKLFCMVKRSRQTKKAALSSKTQDFKQSITCAKMQLEETRNR